MADVSDSMKQEIEEVARRLVWEMVDDEMQEEILMQATAFVSVHRKMMQELQSYADGVGEDAS